jgi:hypothetical protein
MDLSISMVGDTPIVEPDNLGFKGEVHLIR